MAQTHAPAAFVGQSEQVQIRRIGVGDLFDSLRRGIDDFWECPSHYAFAGLLYPVVMLILAIWVSGQNVLPLLFPLLGGFALVGPLGAVFFYEISRRRERGLDTAWWHGIEVLRSPALPAVVGLGIFLCLMFVAWLGCAQLIYQWLYGFDAPESLGGFLYEVLTTPRGWTLIVVGNLVGLLFAVAVLCTTVIAFPMVIDRHGAPYDAMLTSVRAVTTNPVQMVLWGIIVAALVGIAMIPFFLGLVVVMPILGHATWHLYRKVVAQDV